MTLVNVLMKINIIIFYGLLYYVATCNTVNAEILSNDSELEPDTAMSSASFAYILDSDNSTTSIVNLSSFVTESIMLNFLYSKTAVNDIALDYDSNLSLIALMYYLDNKKSIGFEYERSGQTGNLEFETIRGSLNLLLKNWNFSLSPEKSEVTLYVSSLSGNMLTRTGTIMALEASIAYYGFDTFVISIDAIKYDYSFNPKVLNTRFVRRRLSVETLSQANNLLESNSGLNLTYYFSDYSLTLKNSQSVSAVDSSTSVANAIQVSSYYFRNIDIGIELGLIKQDSYGPSSYTYISLAYNW